MSDKVAAPCREGDVLEQLTDGYRRAKRAVTDRYLGTLYDFYDGALFRRRYGKFLRIWEEERKLNAFLIFSSDDFEEIAGHRDRRTAWPLVFTIFHLYPKYRFKARNALLMGFVPGTQDPELFDTFLEPILYDLPMLEGGCFQKCADGKRRQLRQIVFSLPQTNRQ